LLSVLFYILFAIACVVLIVAVLLQPGKADAGALFTNAISSTAFGPRGTATLLAKITIGAAAAFMLIALALSLPIFGTRSVLESQPATANPTATPSPQASPAANSSAAPPANPQQSASPAAANSQPSPASSSATTNANGNSNAATKNANAPSKPAASPQAKGEQKKQ